MNANVWSWVVCCLLGACFHDASALAGGAGTPRVVRVTVRDAAGGAWPLASAPRAAHFDLALEKELTPPSSSPPLYLVQGPADDELLTDLENPPLRKDTRAALVTLSSQVEPARLRATPTASLVPGSRYTLVWIGPEGAQAFPVEISTSPVAGAAFAQSFPADKARDVPRNLRRALLRFDGHLSSAPTFAMHDAHGQVTPVEVRTADCQHSGFASGTCIWLSWAVPLRPESVYTITSTSELRDATFAAVAEVSLTFETAREEDHTPPVLADLPCALDELSEARVCTLGMEGTFSVRAQANEPVLAELLALPARAATLSMLDPLQIDLLGLPPDVPCRFLRLTDLAENVLEIPLCAPIPSELATLTIDEVRADPLGPEPAQEYVELLNFGSKAVVMEGFSLTHDAFSKGAVLRAQSPVLPGERVLVVGPTFDRHHPADGSVPEALRLIRTERSLSLANDGSALFLRDAEGRRLSAAPRLGPARPGQCVYRLADADRRSGSLGAFARDPDGSCTPGAGPSGPP